MHSLRAFAKLNLGLHVLRRRSDGFHDLATVFLPIGWADTLTVAPAGSLKMTCSDDRLPVDDSNLVVKAAKRLAFAFGIERGALMHLEKILPAGAGLGGGSSDAAATLNLLCRLWELNASHEQLRELALDLGSDVPFFLHGRPAYAGGRGELLRPMLDYTMPYTIAVVAPDVHISTAWAFSQIAPSDSGRPDLEAVVRSNDLERWRRELINDFEGPIMRATPRLETLKQLLLECGAGYTSMTGSGSAIYGAFESVAQACAARDAALESGCMVWIEHAQSHVDPSKLETEI